MVLHLESDPNKKTMDFPINTSLGNVPFFETELKDRPEPPPLVSACVLDIELSNHQGAGGALSPMQNSKLSRMINESIVVAGDKG